MSKERRRNIDAAALSAQMPLLRRFCSSSLLAASLVYAFQAEAQAPQKDKGADATMDTKASVESHSTNDLSRPGAAAASKGEDKGQYGAKNTHDGSVDKGFGIGGGAGSGSGVGDGSGARSGERSDGARPPSTSPDKAKSSASAVLKTIPSPAPADKGAAHKKALSKGRCTAGGTVVNASTKDSCAKANGKWSE